MLLTDWISLGMCALLVGVAGWITVSGLRLLQRIDAYVPPSAAKRLGLAVESGQPFPRDPLPAEARDALSAGAVLYLFVSETCSVCTELAPSVPGLIRTCPGVRFVFCSRRPMARPPVRDALYLTGGQLFRSLGIGVIPYAVKVEGGLVVDHGLVNSTEQIESILETTLATRREMTA